MRGIYKKIKFPLRIIKKLGLITGARYLKRWYYANISDLPHEVNFETSAVCNLKCAFCYPHFTGDFAQRSTNKMSLELFKKTVDEIKSFANSISLHGSGEPLANADFFEMIKYAKLNKLEVSFSTNGLLLNEHIVRQLIEIQADKIIICFDGLTFEKYSMHRKPSTERQFNHLIKMSRLLNEEKWKIGNGLPYATFQFIVTCFNYEQINSVAEFARTLGFDKAILMTLSVDEYVHDKNFIEQVKGFLPQDKKYMRYEVDELNEKLHVKNSIDYCPQEVRQPIITADGKILPCCKDIHKMNYVLGDLTKEGFGKLWESGSTIKSRRNLMRRQAEMCNYCFPNSGDISTELYCTK